MGDGRKKGWRFPPTFMSTRLPSQSPPCMFWRVLLINPLILATLSSTRGELETKFWKQYRVVSCRFNELISLNVLLLSPLSKSNLKYKRVWRLNSSNEPAEPASQHGGNYRRISEQMTDEVSISVFEVRNKRKCGSSHKRVVLLLVSSC